MEILAWQRQWSACLKQMESTLDMTTLNKANNIQTPPESVWLLNYQNLALWLWIGIYSLVCSWKFMFSFKQFITITLSFHQLPILEKVSVCGWRICSQN
jgi:hypothetical protein